MKFILILLLFSNALLAKKELRDLYFEIHSDDLKSLVEQKAALAKFDKFFCKVYWMKERKEVVVVADGLSDKLIAAVRGACERKAFLALPYSLEAYLKTFERQKSEKGWISYRDATGLGSVNEVLVKKEKEKTILIEKRSTGTTKIHYYYNQVKSQKQLKRVEVSAYEGIQNIKSATDISRSNIKGFSFPVKMQIKSTQNLIKKGIGNYSRHLSETFYFKNYEVNEAKAILFFSKK